MSVIPRSLKVLSVFLVYVCYFTYGGVISNQESAHICTGSLSVSNENLSSVEPIRQLAFPIIILNSRWGPRKRFCHQVSRETLAVLTSKQLILTNGALAQHLNPSTVRIYVESVGTCCYTLYKGYGKGQTITVGQGEKQEVTFYVRSIYVSSCP